jgi:hypothetical protein
MGIRKSCVTLIGALLGCLSPAAVRAFNADGFWSGMTTAQFAARAAQVGMEARPGLDGKWTLGRTYPPLFWGKFGFCGNTLVSYSRDIHSDADYASTLMQVFAAFGLPADMTFTGGVSTNPGGGAFRSFAFTVWYLGADRVRLKSFFDWRFQSGDFRRVQPASITYETRNPCFTD